MGDQADQPISPSVMSLNTIKFDCPLCLKTFTRKYNLTRHMRIHAQVKPYSCFICQKAFNQINNLNRHEKIHPAEKRFDCAQCISTFTRKDNLKRHTQKQHRVQQKQNIYSHTRDICLLDSPWKVTSAKWNAKLRMLSSIEKPLITWPKSQKVSWDTLPFLIEKLNSWGIIPTQLKNGYINPLNPRRPYVDPWDPCWFNGKVTDYWNKIRVSVRHIQQDFWKKWPQFINRNTVIITNPPFLEKWLRPFFIFLAVLDHPFLLILPHKICDRLYFGETLYDRVKRPNELHIFSLQRSFRMEQKGGRVVGMAGLIVCAYYPKLWNFRLNENNFVRVIPLKCLHG